MGFFTKKSDSITIYPYRLPDNINDERSHHHLALNTLSTEEDCFRKNVTNRVRTSEEMISDFFIFWTDIKYEDYHHINEYLDKEIKNIEWEIKDLKESLSFKVRMLKYLYKNCLDGFKFSSGFIIKEICPIRVEIKNLRKKLENVTNERYGQMKIKLPNGKWGKILKHEYTTYEEFLKNWSEREYRIYLYSKWKEMKRSKIIRNESGEWIFSDEWVKFKKQHFLSDWETVEDILLQEQLLREKYKNGVRIGKNEKKILDDLELIYKYKILRQYQIDSFFLDGYIAELNLPIEIDEKEHFINGKLCERDMQRQKYIQKKLNCKFMRIRDFGNGKYQLLE